MATDQAPCTPRRDEKKSLQNPRSPLLFIPSPSRARVTPPVTPEVPTAPKGLKLSQLNANAPVFIPSSFVSSLAQVPTALRLRESRHDVSEPLPVVSVRKMAAKGCAIVLLRDEKVMELALRMAVAVVDGVCVELRRHSRRSKRDEGDELGIFVAWGHRVERRATVSEEGLEAYFNGLAKVSYPAALDVQPPFQETLLMFPLSSSQSLDLKRPELASATHDLLLQGPHGRPDLVQMLWDAKAQLDELWNKPPPPKARSVMQRVARDQLFPHSKEEQKERSGKSYENRAGEKLEELAQAVGLLKDIPRNARFLDLCGGPGAWSQYLLALGFQGFGFTLRSGVGHDGDWQAEEKDDWYPELLRHPKWSALWGADGTGDLLKPENLRNASRSIERTGGVSICVADGGFSDKAIPANLLELYFYRLFLAEILTAANCLLPGGRFVCKLYTTFSAATSSLLFLVTRLFADVRIVKPMTSRVAGPERYLYASGFRSSNEVKAIRQALWSCHSYADGQSPLQLPLLTPLVNLTDGADAKFLSQLQEMVSTLSIRQSTALRSIRHRAEDLERMALDVARQSEQAEQKSKRRGDEEESHFTEAMTYCKHRRQTSMTSMASAEFNCYQ
ncbi:unnamed protein product [Durusdinium trenchii]|uniref:Cap-specific mRNA (nucleoside-2'-O-)-methyltransferase 1 n=2 Tax=Durusdinium trenchii TaxID=1381693 RepID=A0ABP0QB89_9DINO